MVNIFTDNNVFDLHGDLLDIKLKSNLNKLRYNKNLRLKILKFYFY